MPAAWSVTSPAALRTLRCWETARTAHWQLARQFADRAGRPGEPLEDFFARRVGSASAVSTAAWLVMTYGKLQLTKTAVK